LADTLKTDLDGIRPCQSQDHKAAKINKSNAAFVPGAAET